MAANDSLRTQALSLYRSALRMTRLLPYPQLRSKTRYNIRLLYSVYKDELDAPKIKEIIANGVYDVETFRMVCKVNNGDTAKELFKPFKPVSKGKSDEERDGAVSSDLKHNLAQRERVWLRRSLEEYRCNQSRRPSISYDRR